MINRMLLGVIMVVVMAYLLFGVYLYVNQSRMIYYPEFTQSRYDLQTELFRIDGETIRVHVLNPHQNKAVLYFGGNAESVGFQAEELRLALEGNTLYLVNYRGYGGSTGEPNEQALYSDAAFIFDALAERYEGISVIGRSLGSGIATWLAVNRSIEKLVLVTPFDSLEGLAREHFPFYPASLLLKEAYASIDRVSSIEAPTLILAASHDRIVPMVSTRRLEKAFRQGGGKIIVIPGTDHNSISARRVYFEELAEFFGTETIKLNE